MILRVHYKGLTIGEYPIANPPRERIMSGNTMNIEGIGKMQVRGSQDGVIEARLQTPSPRISRLIKRLGLGYEFEPIEGVSTDALPPDWENSMCDYCKHFEVCTTICFAAS